MLTLHGVWPSLVFPMKLPACVLLLETRKQLQVSNNAYAIGTTLLYAERRIIVYDRHTTVRHSEGGDHLP